MDFGFLNNLAATLLAPRVIWTVLWIGLALLTITLFALMGTRWGQARPLSKCVFLSVFAHMLLVGYASMTELFVAPSPTPGKGSLPDAMRVSLPDNDDTDSQSKAAPERPLEPWEQPATENTVAPEALALVRETIAAETLPQRDPKDAEVSVAGSVPTELVMDRDLRVEGDQPQPVNSLHAHSTNAAVAAIEVPKAQERAPATPAGPPAEDAPRAAPRVGETAPPQRSVIPSLPRELTTVSPDVARLADVLPTTRIQPDVLRSTEDLVAATQNRTLPDAGPARNPSVAPGQEIPDAASPANSPGGIGESSAIATGGAQGADPRASAGDDPRVRAEDRGDPQTGATAGGAAVPVPYELRVQSDRGEIAKEHGGNERTEAAVEAALKWLAENQEVDGRWDADKHGAGRENRVFGHDRGGAGAQADTGVTGLAVLAFMAAGHTHQSGKYAKNVQHGLEFLLNSQSRSDGNMAGGAETFAQMYCHGIATLAIAEAYALTKDERLKIWVQRAIAYTIAAQHSTDGGWRYRPGDEGDMSQFGWQVMALKTAELGGIAIPQKTREGMHRFLGKVSSGRNGGLASYRPREDVSPTMTAEALACRFFLGTLRGEATMNEAADYLDANRPNNDRANLYYWYYGSLAMHQVHDARWSRWNEALQNRLLPSQRQDGRLAGSWDPGVTVWGGYGGRVYTTAMGALCLESYYRFSLTRERAR